MIARRRERPDPLALIAAATLAGIGTALLGLAGRIALWACTIPVAVTEKRHEHRQDND